MGYISAERVAEIRKQIKKEFPANLGWKISVTRHHHSKVRVAILAGPVNMRTDTRRDYEQVNYFYIKEHYKDHPEVEKVLSRIYAIMNKGNRTVSEDADYGRIPAFYVGLNIGDFEKPFVHTALATI